MSWNETAKDRFAHPQDRFESDLTCVDAAATRALPVQFQRSGQALSRVRPVRYGMLVLLARIERREPDPYRMIALGSSPSVPGFPDPVSMTVCACAVLARSCV